MTDDLSARLTALAERTAPPPREDLAGEVVTLHRARRRQRVGLVAAAAAVAAIVVTVPVLLDREAPPPAPAAPTPVTEPWSASDLPPANVYGLPTRGSLAGDTAFVEGVRQLSWGAPQEGVPDAPVDTRHVVFAGDVPGGRWALVAGQNTARPQPPDDDPDLQTDLAALSDVAAVWFVGPPDATPDQMQMVSVPRGVDAITPAGLLDTTTGALVVVGAPGDTLDLSPRPDVAADTTVTRQWRPVDVVDGLAVVDFGATGTRSAAVTYRVTRGGRTWETSPAGYVPDDYVDPGVDPGVAIVPLRPVPEGHDPFLRSAAGEVLRQGGLAAEQVAFTALWSGEVPAPGADPALVDVLAAELPSGAVHLTVSLWLPLGDGSSAGTVCGTGFQSAGPPAADRTVVARCDATDFSGNSETLSSLVVVGPRAAVRARALDADGAVLAEFDLVDGAAAVPAPEGTATVETLDASGGVLESEPPLGWTSWGR